jgi:methionine synthase I (cobalamin-dependent)
MTNEDYDHENEDAEALEPQEQDVMQEIHDFDFQRCAQLMSIAQLVATVAPKATSLLGLAQAELEHMNEQAKDIARRRAERQAEAEQRRYEAEQARLNAEAEERGDEDPETPEPMQQPGTPAPARRL